LDDSTKINPNNLLLGHNTKQCENRTSGTSSPASNDTPVSIAAKRKEVKICFQMKCLGISSLKFDIIIEIHLSPRDFRTSRKQVEDEDNER
jgi:hypothetical protein